MTKINLNYFPTRDHCISFLLDEPNKSWLHFWEFSKARIAIKAPIGALIWTSFQETTISFRFNGAANDNQQFPFLFYITKQLRLLKFGSHSLPPRWQVKGNAIFRFVFWFTLSKVKLFDIYKREILWQNMCILIQLNLKGIASLISLNYFKIEII